MSGESEALCAALLTWVRSLKVAEQCDSVADLTSGVVIAQVLHKIDPGWFNEPWFVRIKQNVGDNWRLKVSNLKKVLKAILDYYHAVLSVSLSGFRCPDVCLLGDTGDTMEAGRLLQLVLGCAVNCDHKEEYIQGIMQLEESVQHVVMAAIQELMSKDASQATGTDSYAELERQLKKTVEALNEALSAKEEMAQRCHELDMQAQCLQEEKDRVSLDCLAYEETVAILQEEKSGLGVELRSLAERLSVLEGCDDSCGDAGGGGALSLAGGGLAGGTVAGGNVPGKRQLQLQAQIDALQEETYRLEASKDDFRLRCEELEQQLVEVTARHDDMSALADAAQGLQDEVDVLRHSVDKVSKLEATVESYRRKLEELGDLRRQVRVLEEKGVSASLRATSLEEELRKSSTLRVQVDTYRRQVGELHARLGEETHRGDRAQFELQRLREKHEAIAQERDRLVVERDSLREANEELHCTQAQQGHLERRVVPPGSPESVPSLDSEIISPEIREWVARLQQETLSLRAELSSQGEEVLRLASVEAQLELSQAREREMDTDRRLHTQRIAELEVELEETQQRLSERHGDAETETSEALKKRLEEYMEKLRRAEEDSQRKQTELSDSHLLLTDARQRADELQETLRRKDEEMRSMEERYKRYLEKAKSVIRTLDPKQNPGGIPDAQNLRSQIQERDKLILNKEREFERARVQRDQEERLLVTAWYNLGLSLQRKSSDNRLISTGPGQSFLARQRQNTGSRGQRGDTGRHGGTGGHSGTQA